MKIETKLEGTLFTALGRYRLTKHCVGLPMLVVELSEETKTMNVYAVFESDTGTSTAIPLENESCVVPWEVTDDADQEVSVGIYAARNDGKFVALSSNQIVFPVEEGTNPSSLTPPKEATPNAFDKLREEVKSLTDKVEKMSQNGGEGLSAYQIWLNAGNSGTEADFLASLKGANGITPRIGENSNWYIGDEDTGVNAQGGSGVYVGSGDMPEDCNVKINPDGIAGVYNPDAKTEDMTVPVGVDENGKLWTAPAGGDIPTGGGEKYRRIARIEIGEEDNVANFTLTKDAEGNALSLTHLVIDATIPVCATKYDGSLKLSHISYPWVFNHEYTAKRHIVKTDVLGGLLYTQYYASDSTATRITGTPITFCHSVSEDFIITSIAKGTAYSGGYMPAGTTFDIWGY